MLLLQGKFTETEINKMRNELSKFIGKAREWSENLCYDEDTLFSAFEEVIEVGDGNHVDVFEAFSEITGIDWLYIYYQYLENYDTKCYSDIYLKIIYYILIKEGIVL